MLESVSQRLCERGGPHFGSPDKDPAVRLETIRLAGEQGVPFTTGILIGIGETRAERIQSLLAIRDLHERYGHIQEIIIQNFRAKPGTRMAQIAGRRDARASLDHRGRAPAVRAGDEHPGAAQSRRRRARAADRRRHQRLGRRLAGDAGSRQSGSAVAAVVGAGSGVPRVGQAAGRAARDLSAVCPRARSLGRSRAANRRAAWRRCRRLAAHRCVVARCGRASAGERSDRGGVETGASPRAIYPDCWTAPRAAAR